MHVLNISLVIFPLFWKLDPNIIGGKPGLIKNWPAIMFSIGLSSETSIFIFLISFVLRFEEGIARICCVFCCWLVSILWLKTISFASRFLFSRLAYSELRTRPPLLSKAWSCFPWDSILLLVLRAVLSVSTEGTLPMICSFLSCGCLQQI